MIAAPSFIEGFFFLKLIVERAQRTGLSFSIFPTIRRPNCSSGENRPRSKKSKFLKNEKIAPGYSPKEQAAPKF